LSILNREVPRVFAPLLTPARYKGAWGGRGSGKSHFFGEQLIEDHLAERGLLSVCIREVQRTLENSSKRLLETKIRKFGLSEADGFKVFKDRIETPGDGVLIFIGMTDQTADSIKSLEGFGRAWMEEAQAISQRSLTLLRPTIRAAGSEIWASWNPRRATDAVNEFFRRDTPSNATVVQANWRDNPWFTKELEAERLLDLEKYPDRYQHIWEGEYAKAFEGAYFAKHLADASAQGRICKLAADPMLSVRAYWDIGGAGAKADANAIWIVQFVQREIRVLDYIEGVGQVLAYYVNELKSRGWGKALCFLPHDGINANNVTGKQYKDHIADAGFEVTVIPNQGKGAAMMRVEAARRLFPQIWFNDTPAVESGRDALGYYHERKDENRGVGLGPEHDWSSNGADAFGLMCVCYEEPQKVKSWAQPSAKYVV